MKQRAVYVKPKTEILEFDGKDVATLWNSGENSDVGDGDDKNDFEW